MLPTDKKRTKPQPWVLYAPTLPGLPDQHEKWMHERFLDAGIAVGGIDVGESYGSPRGRELFTAFYREMTNQRGWALKACLLCRSRGGLWVTNWAADHPDKVAGLAGIYPAFDLLTYPGLGRRNRQLYEQDRRRGENACKLVASRPASWWSGRVRPRQRCEGLHWNRSHDA